MEIVKLSNEHETKKCIIIPITTNNILVTSDVPLWQLIISNALPANDMYFTYDSLNINTGAVQRLDATIYTKSILILPPRLFYSFKLRFTGSLPNPFFSNSYIYLYPKTDGFIGFNPGRFSVI